jgi:hypothetical protein
MRRSTRAPSGGRPTRTGRYPAATIGGSNGMKPSFDPGETGVRPLTSWRLGVVRLSDRWTLPRPRPGSGRPARGQLWAADPAQRWLPRHLPARPVLHRRKQLRRRRRLHHHHGVLCDIGAHRERRRSAEEPSARPDSMNQPGGQKLNASYMNDRFHGRFRQISHGARPRPGSRDAGTPGVQTLNTGAAHHARIYPAHITGPSERNRRKIGRQSSHARFGRGGPTRRRHWAALTLRDRESPGGSSVASGAACYALSNPRLR